nr:apolipoprotein N-acyltransferase [Thaumasiovibrio subtropicus]
MPVSLIKYLRPLGAVFSGAIATFSFAPYHWWPLAIVSTTVLLLCLHKQSAKQGALIGLLWGLGQFGTGISWVHVSIANFGGVPLLVGWFMMALLIGYLALYPAAFGYLYNRFFRQLSSPLRLVLFAPILWLLLDWLRGWFLTGFPWLWLGYSQTEGPMAPIAPILGVEGITVAIVVISAALAGIIAEKRYRLISAPLLIATMTFVSHQTQWVTPEPERKVDIAIIQGNIAQELKWLPSQRWPTLMTYADLTRKNWQADIVIWPEAAIPALEEEVAMFIGRMDSAAKLNEATLITGVLDHVGEQVYFNNILTIGENGQDEYTYETAQRYSKHHLLPFGEFVPFESILRPLAPIFNLPMSSFSRGDYIQPNLIAGENQIAPALCYEVAYNEQVRRNVTADTDILLTLSNDAWFGASIGPHQHLEIAQMRALELGRPMIRSTNTGISALINHKGQIIATIPQFEQTVLRDYLVPTVGQTPYHRYGSMPLWIASLLGLGLLLVAQRKQKPATCCQ